MVLDPLEKEHLRKKMATRISMFLESQSIATCVSAHIYEEETFCELCQTTHTKDILVIRNRSGKTMKVALSCLKEMIRFRIVEIDELPRWMNKLKELRIEAEKKKAEELQLMEEKRKALEKKVIVRRKK